MGAWLDYYRILEVHAHDERTTIESMYKKLCKKYHPDLNPSPDAESRMKDINCAWEVLRDEEKRRGFHREWLRRNGPVGGARQVLRPQPPKPPQTPAQMAKSVLAQYFLAISGGRYEEAYRLLSAADKANINYDSFWRWQSNVAATYHIQSFHVLSSKPYPEFSMNDGRTCVAERVTLSISETNVREGGSSQSRLVKFVVREDKDWRVYLGYRDVEFISEQFSVLSGMGAEHFQRCTDMATGLPNRIGFLEKCKVEAYRFERYGRVCTMGVVQAALEKPRLMEEEMRRQVLAQTSFSLRSTVRLIDIVGVLAEGMYGVLLSETGSKEASSAVRRISKRVENDILVCFDSEIRLKWNLRTYSGGEMRSLLDRLQSG